MKISQQKTSTKVFMTILICLLVVLLVAVTIQFSVIINKKNKQAKLQATLQKTEQQIKEYDELLDYINYRNGEYSEEFLSSYAREVLGWGKADKTYYTGK